MTAFPDATAESAARYGKVERDGSKTISSGSERPLWCVKCGAQQVKGGKHLNMRF